MTLFIFYLKSNQFSMDLSSSYKAVSPFTKITKHLQQSLFLISNQSSMARILLLQPNFFSPHTSISTNYSAFAHISPSIYTSHQAINYKKIFSSSKFPHSLIVSLLQVQVSVFVNWFESSSKYLIKTKYYINLYNIYD